MDKELTVNVIVKMKITPEEISSIRMEHNPNVPFPYTLYIKMVNFRSCIPEPESFGTKEAAEIRMKELSGMNNG